MTGMLAMAICSFGGFVPSAFAIVRYDHVRPGRTAMLERLIGSIRRECIDHVVVFGERHLRHMLLSYVNYYNTVRTHLSLAKDSPLVRPVHAVGRIQPVPVLGGLHHQYIRI